MQENYLISILGKQNYDGELDEGQLTTVGSYITKGNSRYILYREYDSDEPTASTTSILKIDGNRRVTLIRSGHQRSRLILEKGKRHLCHYDTGFGTMMVGVFAHQIKADLNDRGGNLEVSYSLDINSRLKSLNEIFINVKETGSHVETNRSNRQ